jgi:hypothetical protein
MHHDGSLQILPFESIPSLRHAPRWAPVRTRTSLETSVKKDGRRCSLLRGHMAAAVPAKRARSASYDQRGGTAVVLAVVVGRRDGGSWSARAAARERFSRPRHGMVARARTSASAITLSPSFGSSVSTRPRSASSAAIAPATFAAPSLTASLAASLTTTSTPAAATVSARPRTESSAIASAFRNHS